MTTHDPGNDNREPNPDPDDGELEPDEPEEVTAEPGDDPEPAGEAPRPINWRTLSGEDAEYEWLSLNEWVNWLRHTFGLPASVIPPYWHRHPELVWELSALHLHWLGAYDPAQHASAPLGWMADFHAAIGRLREWVTLSGTRLDRDRPTRQTTWPGEDPQPAPAETAIVDRDHDFVGFVIEDVNRREQAEADFYRRQDDQP